MAHRETIDEFRAKAKEARKRGDVVIRAEGIMSAENFYIHPDSSLSVEVTELGLTGDERNHYRFEGVRRRFGRNILRRVHNCRPGETQIGDKVIFSDSAGERYTSPKVAYVGQPID